MFDVVNESTGETVYFGFNAAQAYTALDGIRSSGHKAKFYLDGRLTRL